MQNDAISRSAVEEIITNYRTLLKLREIPALDVAPVVHARWIVIRMAGERVAIQCSACKNYDNPSKVRGNYCWNCGARMDYEEDENAAD